MLERYIVFCIASVFWFGVCLGKLEVCGLMVILIEEAVCDMILWVVRRYSCIFCLLIPKTAWRKGGERT